MNFATSFALYCDFEIKKIRRCILRFSAKL